MRPTRLTVPVAVLSACLGLPVPAGAELAAPAPAPKGVTFLKAGQWPKVAEWGKWSGSSDPGTWTVIMCGVRQLPKPYGDTEYHPSKRQGVSGREWISDAGSKKAAATLVKGFEAVLRDCAAGYGQYTPKPSSSKVHDRTPKNSRRLRVYAEHLMSGFSYSKPPAPGYRLWGVAQRGRHVVVVSLSASGEHKTAPLKAFIKTAHAAVDGAI